jgi:hypothetical protein
MALLPDYDSFQKPQRSTFLHGHPSAYRGFWWQGSFQAGRIGIFFIFCDSQPTCMLTSLRDLEMVPT